MPTGTSPDCRRAPDHAASMVRVNENCAHSEHVSCTRSRVPMPQQTTNTMVLTVELTGTEEGISTFTLIRGTPGRVVKCLLPLHTVVSCLGRDSRIAR